MESTKRRWSLLHSVGDLRAWGHGVGGVGVGVCGKAPMLLGTRQGWICSKREVGLNELLPPPKFSDDPRSSFQRSVGSLPALP